MTSAAPSRIQRKRTKGWKMPPNTVYVGRPTKWGNPFRPSEKMAAGEAVGAYYLAMLREQLGFTVWDVRAELRGKNLACWCAPGSVCHADVLLIEANRTEYDEEIRP